MIKFNYGFVGFMMPNIKTDYIIFTERTEQEKRKNICEYASAARKRGFIKPVNTEYAEDIGKKILLVKNKDSKSVKLYFSRIYLFNCVKKIYGANKIFTFRNRMGDELLNKNNITKNTKIYIPFKYFLLHLVSLEGNYRTVKEEIASYDEKIKDFSYEEFVSVNTYIDYVSEETKCKLSNVKLFFVSMLPINRWQLY